MPSRKQDKAGPDALQFLKQDHETVRRMFEEFEKAGDDRRFELATEICQALAVHAAIEEEIFYPRVREVIAAEDLMLEAEIEHDTVKQLIERIQDGEIDEPRLTAMIKVLQEYVSHHVNEEQRRMFPRVKRTELDLAALGRELQARKQEIEAELGTAIADEARFDDDESETDDEATGQSRGGMAARGPSGGDD